MTGDVQDVVDAPSDPVVAIRVTATTVTGEVQPREAREVGVAKTSVIPEQRARLPRPWLLQAEIAFDIVAQELLAMVVDQHGLDAKEWQRRRARLRRGRARQRRDKNAAG